MQSPLEILSRRRLIFAIVSIAWLASLIISIATAIAHWQELSSVERDRVLLMNVSWLALPAVAVLVARGYLSESSGSDLRSRARR